MRYTHTIILVAAAALLSACKEDGTIDTMAEKSALGKSLFQDTTLSANRTMACATCHDLDLGLIDPRSTSMTLGASLGDDGSSIGDRNTPTAAYAAFSPAFHFDEDEELFIGGQFLDGRALDLKAQAKGPFLNPIEMGMPDIASVLARVKENDGYVQKFKKLYGSDIFLDETKAYDALADAIALFEKSETFSPFDSKYDRFLLGKYSLNAQEARGLAIFSDESTDPGAGRCTLCHPISADDGRPLMTDFSYDNLGVPVNHALRTANGMSGNDDVGLFGNPAVSDEDLKGAFKVSTLRNIAVTGPYMHNGIFEDLKTVIHFYNTRDVSGAINPETGSIWELGEFHSGRNVDELGDLGLSDAQEDDVVAFLKTFTDAKYEHLIP
jgi:cytochrome c peroxidase